MRHYAFNVGDYAAATAHLSDAEDLAYRRLLDAYYSREAPLPADVGACCRLARATSAPARKAVDTVLREFFSLKADGWHQARCDRDLADFAEKAEKARASATARWTHSERNANASANAMRTQCEGNATHNPLPITHKNKSKDKAPVAASPLPGWLDKPTWDRFLEARSAMKARATPHAQALLLRDLAKLREQGQDPTAVLEQSISRSWRGLFAVKGDAPTRKTDQRTAFADSIIGAVTHGQATDSADPRDISGEAERVA